MIRALEFYSGIGGLHLALQRSGVEAEVVRAFDWDPAASQVYTEIWGKNLVQRGDITQLTAAELAPLNASLWLLSPACQPYTVLNSSAKGAADPRARSFLHLVETVIPDLSQLGAHPRWILVENVAGFETSSTRQILLVSLKTLGYVTAEFLLTPLQFSTPNSRLRYYLLAKLSSHPFSPPTGMKDPSIIRRRIPGHGADWIDPRHRTPDDPADQSPCLEISHFLDDPSLAQNYEYWQAFAVPDKVLQKRGVLFDIVLPHHRRTCCFTRGYTHMVEGTSILQMNETLDTTATFDAYAASIASPLTNPAADPLQLLHALRLRYFTPDELLRLFHFLPTVNNALAAPDPPPMTTFRWPSGISQKTKYRLIGNSVNVKVVQELISYLFAEDAL